MTQIDVLDIAELLDDEATITAYLNDMLEDTPEAFVQALNTVARARGMHQIAQQADMGRTVLYRSLSSKKPRFETMTKVLDAMGYRLAVVAK